MAYNGDKRLLDLNPTDEFADDDYVYVDGATNGSRKYPAQNLSALLPLTVVNGELCVIYVEET